MIDEHSDRLRIADVLLADGIRIMQEETAHPDLDAEECAESGTRLALLPPSSR